LNLRHRKPTGWLFLEVFLELLAALRVAQLGKRLGFDLANPLTGDSKFLANLFQGVGLTVFAWNVLPHLLA
jgi:hypothetical protein